MKQIETKIYLDNDLFIDEFAYRFGAKKDEVSILFTYLHIKDDRKDKTISRKFTYPEALKFAEERQRDGRYRNYKFLLSIAAE